MLKSYNNCHKKTSCSKCKKNDFCSSWFDFVKKHSETKRYAHFDARVSIAMPTVRKYVMDPQKVAKHGFYPFIHYINKTKKFSPKPKPPKERNINYCSHMDRCVYQRYSFLLNYYYNQKVEEYGINECAIAYRDNLEKNNIDFAKSAFDFIKLNPDSIVIIGDFKNFFDRIDHTYLKNRLCDLLDVPMLPNDYYAVFKNITRYSTWEWNDLITQNGFINRRGILNKMNNRDTILSRDDFKKYSKSIKKHDELYGIPQGSPISAVLSNVYMLDFDRQINCFVKQFGGKYLRYSDDIFVAVPCEENAEAAYYTDYLYSVVDAIPMLQLQKDKTKLYRFKKGQCFDYDLDTPSWVDYLGFIYNGEQVKIRPKAITKYYYRMRRKAKHIGKSHWVTYKGHRITAKNLYNTYSSGGDRQTFIDYAKRATKILELDDPEAEALIKHHKMKIARAIKEGANPSSKQ